MPIMRRGYYLGNVGSGNRIPIDIEPRDDGNFWLDRDQFGVGAHATAHADPVARSVDLFTDANELRYVAHFVTCPQADEWRKENE